MPDNLIGYIAVAFVVVMFAAILVRYFRRQYGRTQTDHAVIVNKQKTDVFSQYSGTGKEQRYFVTFLVNGKHRSFSVSKFSYNGYRIGETGTLKFKGDRLIDFG